MAVSGLPDGTAAALTVAGPEGFTQDLTDSETLAALTPGAYTITAFVVSRGGAGYAPTPNTQTVNVAAGSAATAASIDYVLAVGRLSIAVAGLPSGAQPTIDVAGPALRQRVTGGTTLTGLAPGPYTVTAASVTTGGALYNPSPRSQTIAVDLARAVTAHVTYAASTSGVFNLSIDGLYIVQSTQTYDGAVPLLERRQGVLRIFGRANQANDVRPPVRVRLYRNGTLFSTETVAAAGPSAPTAVDEGDLNASWNVVIPADQLRPGLAVAADIDPDHEIAEGNEDDNNFPASGGPMAMNVRPAPPVRVRFVPVYQSASDRLGQVTAGNRDLFLATALRIHPIVDVVSDVRNVYTTSAAPLDGDDDDSWGRVLSEVNALRLGDPDAGGIHYYGVVNTGYASGIAGLGYVAGRSAIGWDYLPSGASVAAHELGHNWGRYHAPCGNVSHPDTRYPYPGGTVGVYGFDLEAGTVKPPSSTDLMGYCGSQWISDYTYLAVMNFRETDPAVAAAAKARAPAAGLLVWGRIVDGELRLEPAFRVVAPPSLPERPGPYSVEGRASDGSTIFALSFAADEVADARRDERQFAFVVPLSSARAARIASLRLAGRGRATLVSAAAPARVRFRLGTGPGAAAVRRAAGRRIALHWDAAAHPMIMVRDPSSGRILSFARGGDAEIVADGNELELVASDRVHSESLRVRIAP